MLLPDDAPDPRAVLEAFGLPGEVLGTDPVDGGWSNRVLRLRTDRGDLLVKQVQNPWGVARWRDWLDEGWRLETAARAAGVRAPEPVVAPDGGCLVEVDRVDGAGTVPVRLHRWVEARAVPREPVDDAIAAWTGSVLATVHRLALRPHDPRLYADRDGLTTAAPWPELVRRSAGTGWVDDLAAAEPWATRATALLEPWDDADAVLCHGDLDQKNLLVDVDGPMLCDWDVVLPTVPSHDLAHAALTLAGWQDPRVARAVLAAYHDAGAEVGPLRPADLGPALASRLGWVRFTVDRALAEPSVDAEGLVRDALAVLARRVAVAENLVNWLG